MGAGRHVKRSGGRGRPKRADSRWPPAMWGMGIIGALLFGIAFAGYSIVKHDASMQAERSAMEAVSASDIAWNPTWPPLPDPDSPSPWAVEDIRAAYAFAARHADVLQFVPCYCGCEQHGHRSNLDCYIRDREAGEPVWDDHAFT